MNSFILLFYAVVIILLYKDYISQRLQTECDTERSLEMIQNELLPVTLPENTKSRHVKWHVDNWIIFHLERNKLKIISTTTVD